MHWLCTQHTPNLYEANSRRAYHIMANWFARPFLDSYKSIFSTQNVCYVCIDHTNVQRIYGNWLQRNLLLLIANNTKHLKILWSEQIVLSFFLLTWYRWEKSDDVWYAPTHRTIIHVSIVAFSFSLWIISCYKNWSIECITNVPVQLIRIDIDQ